MTKANLRNDRTAIALENQLHWNQINDAYRDNPKIHNNVDVLKLLLCIQNNLDNSFEYEDDGDRLVERI